ncbi:hypothetical protein JOF56_006426 [Kibdelosporangium banguiense]|uniref:Uncharacterized protein n=1 Tax=Kibdelosporangium banguiense TaxID=1365924 RepID=A0ABS4TNR0_9PSEU|nr:hypothetical protein [Kibdelosporangium banguiense]MBP2326041.1 hypothetical protein [Kibdelosporangium banguiense]
MERRMEEPNRTPHDDPRAPLNNPQQVPLTQDGTPAPFIAPASITYLQRLAGNRAVAGHLGVPIQRQVLTASGSVDDFVALGDPEVIVTKLAEAPLAERQYLTAQPDGSARLEAAIGSSLRPIAQRILSGAASATVPSLDEATWFRCDRAIHANDRAKAFQVLIAYLSGRGLINNASGWSYVARSDEGEGVTNFQWVEDPATHERRATSPTVEIYDPAFQDVAWLYSTVMHENVHVQQVRAGAPGSEFDAAGEQRPEFVARDEVLAYLWEIEHSEGTGLSGTANAAGNASSTSVWRTNVMHMQEVARRLTTEFNSMTPGLQASLRTRYDAAQQKVRDFDLGVPQQSVDDARQTVQESSRQIQQLLDTRTPENEREVDAQIDAIRRRRAGAMAIVALTDNPLIEVVEPGDPGVYRVPTVDAEGRVRYLHGGLQVAWHLAQASTSAYSLGETLSAGGEMTVAGTAIQGRVHPFPPDVDFDEHIHVVANTRQEAGRMAAERLVANIRRISGGPVPGSSQVEFRHLLTFPEGGRGIRMSLDDINSGDAVATLGRAIANLAGGNMNTFWRGYVVDDPAHPEERRFTTVTKVVFVSATKPDGTELMATSGSADFNLAYLEVPDEIPRTSLAEFATAMRSAAVEQADRGNWLKAAKRAYNYFSTIGDLAGMSALEPVFSQPQTNIEQYATVIDAIQNALELTDMGVRQPRTRIISRDEALNQVERAAAMVEQRLPAVPGRTSPEAIARDLRELATRFEARDSHGNLKPDPGLAALFGREATAIRELINVGVQSRVEPIIDRLRLECRVETTP